MSFLIIPSSMQSYNQSYNFGSFVQDEEAGWLLPNNAVDTPAVADFLEMYPDNAPWNGPGVDPDSSGAGDEQPTSFMQQGLPTYGYPVPLYDPVGSLGGPIPTLSSFPLVNGQSQAMSSDPHDIPESGQSQNVSSNPVPGKVKRKTVEERRLCLERDEYVMSFTPKEVICSGCNKISKLDCREKAKYYLTSWHNHKLVCDGVKAGFTAAKRRGIEAQMRWAHSPDLTNLARHLPH